MQWNKDIDALEFRPSMCEWTCVIHRLAFRALLQNINPTAYECLQYAAAHLFAFDAAALSKAKHIELMHGMRFHISSRDVRRFLTPQPD